MCIEENLLNLVCLHQVVVVVLLHLIVVVVVLLILLLILHYRGRRSLGAAPWPTRGPLAGPPLGPSRPSVVGPTYRQYTYIEMLKRLPAWLVLLLLL
jgi:hypothetical protein